MNIEIIKEPNYKVLIKKYYKLKKIHLYGISQFELENLC